MGAAELLVQVQAAGLVVVVARGKLLVSPASMLTDDLRAALRASKPDLIELLALQPADQQTESAVDQPHHALADRTCADCMHLGRHGTCLVPVSAGLLTQAEGFGIVWQPASYGAGCAAFTGKAPAEAVKRPYSLTKTLADAAHARPRDDATMARFLARVKHLSRLGVVAKEAEDLAERLALRDRDGDDRRLCLECAWLGDAGRCLAAASGHLAGVDWRLKPVQTILQRCMAFRLREDLV